MTNAEIQNMSLGQWQGVCDKALGQPYGALLEFCGRIHLQDHRRRLWASAALAGTKAILADADELINQKGANHGKV